jgi:hypothetical protein
MMQMPVTHGFLADFSSRYRLKPAQVQVLQMSGTRSPESIASLLESFPSLAKTGLVDAPTLSYAATAEYGGSDSAMLAAADSVSTKAMETLNHSFGAAAPENGLWPMGAHVDLPPPAGSIAEALETARGAIASPPLALGMCEPWAVKDQGRRETCVSFAVAALREQLACEQMGSIDHLAEQFLHWAVKTRSADPYRNVEPSYILYALQMIDRMGICLEPSCPYNATPIPGNPSQDVTPHAPNAGAISQAQLRAHRPIQHEFTHRIPNGKAAKVIAALDRQRAVAVSLPVFRDPMSGANNWQTRVGKLFGYVIDPPPGTTVSGGHAVCVVGFQPDPEEPNGGHFILRNSWGASWGTNLPIHGYAGQAPGYGQVSASYVDKYLWELGFL